MNGNQALRLNTVLPSNASYRVVTEGGAVGQYPGGNRFDRTTQSYFLHTLQGKGSSDPVLSPSVADNGSSYTLTLAHPSRGTATIVLQKGMTSTGGSLNGIPLTEGMQDTSVNDNGPVWGAGAATLVPRRHRTSDYSLKRNASAPGYFRVRRFRRLVDRELPRHRHLHHVGQACRKRRHPSLSSTRCGHSSAGTGRTVYPALAA